MDLNRDAVDELLGAWALDGLEPDERVAVERLLATDPHLAARASRLRSALGGLARSSETDVPGELVDSIVAAAVSTPRPPAPTSSPAAIYANQVEALRALLGTLDDADWTSVADPYRWTVHGLVAHLLVIERYTAAGLGLEGGVPTNVTSHLGAGAEIIESELTRHPTETARSWGEVARRIVDHLDHLDHGDGGEVAPRAIDFHGWTFTAPQLLVARAFEIWTHADDIRRATGRSTVAPDPADLRAMSTLSVTSLPVLLSAAGTGHRDVAARIVLTGDGGGVFDLGEPSQRRSLVVADVVDYCRLAARRVSLDEFDHEVEGDVALAQALLVAARAFAV